MHVLRSKHNTYDISKSSCPKCIKLKQDNKWFKNDKMLGITIIAQVHILNKNKSLFIYTGDATQIQIP